MYVCVWVWCLWKLKKYTTEFICCTVRFKELKTCFNFIYRFSWSFVDFKRNKVYLKKFKFYLWYFKTKRHCGFEKKRNIKCNLNIINHLFKQIHMSLSSTFHGSYLKFKQFVDKNFCNFIFNLKIIVWWFKGINIVIWCYDSYEKLCFILLYQQN